MALNSAAWLYTYAVWRVLSAEEPMSGGPHLGHIGYITPTVLKSPQRFIAGDEIRDGPRLGSLASQPLQFIKSPTFQSR